MKNYKVTITEKLELVVEVAASSRAEAEQLVEQQYKRCDHVLNADHFTGVTFTAKLPERERGRGR